MIAASSYAPLFRDKLVTSWGRVKRQCTGVAQPHYLDELPQLLGATASPALLAIGAGRSYGDSGLNDGGRIVDMTTLDHLIAFDRQSGIVRAEAGITLDALLRVIVPAGWYLPTTPGTRFVTLGGAVANDVHGKNHHSAGTFGSSVLRLGLMRSNNADVLEITPASHPDLFRATVAGLGLTGLIAWVEVKLHRIRSSKLSAETIAFTGYRDFMELSAQSADDWEHTVAWIDCTSGSAGTNTRGLFSRANWLPAGPLVAHSEKTLANLPLEAPSNLINPVTLRAFNTLYYAAGRRKSGVQIVDYAPFFYPLDAILNWNRAYGKNGFYQYQCVVPMSTADSAIPEMLRLIARSGDGSCLAVLKTFGDKPSPGMLSFPFEGVTLALDFPNRSERTQGLFANLDDVVSAAQGRLYPAKDGRMPAAMFRAGYPELDSFAHQVDPNFQSDFWRRVNT